MASAMDSDEDASTPFVRVEVPADLEQLRTGREVLDGWLTAQGRQSRRRRAEMTLVFVELLANAIEASRPTDTVVYTFSADAKELVLVVENPNPFGQSVELQKMPDPVAEGGRGLALAQQLSDRVDVDWMGGSVSISAHFYRPPLD